MLKLVKSAESESESGAESELAESELAESESELAELEGVGVG